MINTSNDVVSRKDVPFRGPENKVLHFHPHFPQKIANFRQILTGLGNFRLKKALTRKRAIAKALHLEDHSDFAPVDLAYYQHFKATPTIVGEAFIFYL